MGKFISGNQYNKSIWNVILVIGMSACLGGCAPDASGLQAGGESLGENRSERRLYLEELEREVSTDGADESAAEDISGGDVWELPADGSFLCESAGAYDYFGLSESEQLWYRDMADAMGKLSDKIKLSEEGILAGLDETAVDRIFQAVLNDHPELFYVEGYNYTKYTRAEKTVAIEFTGTYSMDRDAVLERRREIETEVSRILAGAPGGECDYDKIKYVYERLILDTEYDMDSADNQNIYSVFVGHASVCQGYAKAFQYLMNRMGVECALVQGKVRETGEGHAWNLVKADGDFYYVDATWGDISYQSDGQPTGGAHEALPDISYDYLCITTEQLLRTHILANASEMPQCTADRDNYYVREGALFTDYDVEQLRQLVERRLEEGRFDIALRCADEQCYAVMCEALLERREIFDYLTGSGINSFVYSNNDQQLTLTFFMVTSEP